jgi:hypothetical protein
VTIGEGDTAGLAVTVGASEGGVRAIRLQAVVNINVVKTMVLRIFFISGLLDHH